MGRQTGPTLTSLQLMGCTQQGTLMRYDASEASRVHCDCSSWQLSLVSVPEASLLQGSKCDRLAHDPASSVQKRSPGLAATLLLACVEACVSTHGAICVCLLEVLPHINKPTAPTPTPLLVSHTQCPTPLLVSHTQCPTPLLLSHTQCCTALLASITQCHTARTAAGSMYICLHRELVAAFFVSVDTTQ